MKPKDNITTDTLIRYHDLEARIIYSIITYPESRVYEGTTLRHYDATTNMTLRQYDTTGYDNRSIRYRYQYQPQISQVG